MSDRRVERGCLVSACTDPHHALGLCKPHYERWKVGALNVATEVRRVEPAWWCECEEPKPGPGGWSIGCDTCKRLIRPAERSVA